MRRLLRWCLTAAAVVGGSAMVPACAAESSYQTAEPIVAGTGSPTAGYPVPPEAPRGQLGVTARGVVSIAPRGGGEPQPMLAVELVVANDRDGGPWRLNAQAQRLTFASGETCSPALVSAGEPGAPVLLVPPGRSLRVDLYFPVPPGLEPEGLARFQLSWRIETPAREVAALTPFEMPVSEEGDVHSTAPPLGPDYVGGGPAWWYDPFYYPAFAFPPLFSHGVPRFGHQHFDRGRAHDRDDVFRGHGPSARAYAPGRGRPAPGVPMAPNHAAPGTPRPAPAMPSMAAPARSAPAMPSAPHTPAPVAPPPAMRAAPPPPPAVPAHPNVSAPAPHR
jgi:hypothetical protein